MKLCELKGIPNKMHVMEEYIRNDNAMSNRELSRKVRNFTIDEISDLEIVEDVEKLAIEIYYMDFPHRKNGITKWRFIGQAEQDICRDRSKRLLETLPNWLSLKVKDMTDDKARKEQT